MKVAFVLLGRSEWLSRPPQGVTIAGWIVVVLLLLPAAVYVGRAAGRNYLRMRIAKPAPRVPSGTWRLVAGSVALPLALSGLVWWLTASLVLAAVAAIAGTPACIALFALVYGAVKLRRGT